MNRRKIVFVLIVAFAIIGVSYFIANAGTSPSVPERVSLDLSNSMPPDKTTNELIDFWRGRTDDNPQDFISLTYLGQMFQRKARETGDVSDYVRAETAFRKALAIDPKYENAQGYMSAVLFSMHNFQGALDQANQVFSNDPHALLALGTIGDAQVELGNYADAEKSYQTLMDRDPSPPVYSRMAHLVWLQGHPNEALDLMQRAANDSVTEGDTSEEAAWYEFQLGELNFNSGRIDEAEKHYTAALNLFSNYHFALTGLGKVRAAQERYDAAIEFYQRAVNIIPQPVSVAALGDLYTITGNPDKAQQQYNTVDFIGKLAAINQVVYNRELAFFNANHDRKMDEALNLASKELAIRKDIYAYDAQAWALYKNGRYHEAAQDMDQAMKLGTQDAMLYYHAGMIYAGLGDHQRAKALLTQAMAINPHFDLLQSRVAQATLDQLQAE